MLTLQDFFDAAIQNVKAGDWKAVDNENHCVYQVANNKRLGCFIGQAFINKGLMKAGIAESRASVGQFFRFYPHLNYALSPELRPDYWSFSPLARLQLIHDEGFPTKQGEVIRELEHFAQDYNLDFALLFNI